MKSLLKDNWFAIGIGILIIVVLTLLSRALSLYSSDFINIAWYALVGFTAIYAFASIIVMTATSKQAKETRRIIEEMRQSRLDAVKPALSLEPGMFTMDGKFNALYLVNSGGVAKEIKIEINITNPTSKKALFMTALNRERMAYLPIDNISILYTTDGLVEISVTYKDSYDQILNTNLSFDFAKLKEEGRNVIGQESELYEIKRALEQIEREIGRGR